MTAKLIDGKSLSEKVLADLRTTIQQSALPRPPALAVILVGADKASDLYVSRKAAACDRVGMTSFVDRLPEDTTEEALLARIDALNEDPTIDGILVQMPLPPHINADAIVERIKPHKDVDGFHPYNLGRLAQRRPLLRPCTPHGIIALLKSIDVAPRGKEVVVVGSSNIVGRPMVLELLIEGATVTNCHRFTQDLAAHVKAADIVIVAVGKPELVKGEWIKPGAVVIDVGINRLDNGKIVGDVEFERAFERASYITPVPGGVGPMTVAMLMENTVLAQKLQAQLSL